MSSGPRIPILEIWSDEIVIYQDVDIVVKYLKKAYKLLEIKTGIKMEDFPGDRIFK